MRIILINPDDLKMGAMDVAGFRAIKEIIGTETPNFIPFPGENGHTIWVNGERTQEGSAPFFIVGYNDPMFGMAVITGRDQGGYSCSATMDELQAALGVKFPAQEFANALNLPKQPGRGGISLGPPAGHEAQNDPDYLDGEEWKHGDDDEEGEDPPKAR